MNMFDMSSPVYTEVQFALVFELRQQLLLRLPNSHTLSEHSIQKELAGLSKQNNTCYMCTNIFLSEYIYISDFLWLTSGSLTSSWYTFTLYSPFFSARPNRIVICSTAVHINSVLFMYL